MSSPPKSPTDSATAVSRRQLSWRRKLGFGLLTVVLFFVGLEVLLRLSGFEHNTDVERMTFTFPIDDYNQSSPEPLLVRDDSLFWKPRPEVLGHNAYGFYGPEISRQKRPGVFRIVCLGDSCTHFGPTTYPDMLGALLEQRAPGKFEVINAGVIGYTSHQGLTLLRETVLALSPDLVTVYFGWNDHWLARGLEDKDQTSGQPSAVVNLLAGARVYQLASLAKSNRTASADSPMRVPLETYADNLAQIYELSREHGADAWFLTAPHALDRGIPPYLATSGEVTSLASVLPLHQRYNQTVRDVGEQLDAEVIDLAAEMNRMDKSVLFIEDHIHLSDPGKYYVAKRLLETLQSRGIVEAEPSDTMER